MAAENPHVQLAIVSDANTVFIQNILDAQGLQVSNEAVALSPVKAVQHMCTQFDT